MKTFSLISLTVTLFSSLGAVHVVAAEDWRVVNSSTVKQTESRYTLTLDLSDKQSNVRKVITDQTPIEKVVTAYVYQDKVVVLGEAGLTQAVVIFSLTAGIRLDWFYCYEPQAITSNWIVYVEYYPNHTQGNPSDVVLIYDLDKSPLGNRLQKTSINERYPTSVGIPIYPLYNFQEASYKNFVENTASANIMLGPPFFLYLSSQRLVFLAGQRDSEPLRNHLVAIDLARGPSNAAIEEIAIPFDQLKMSDVNRIFLRATRMEEVTPSTVKLYIPKTEYGIDNLLIHIPSVPK